jgi:hypothetical protein
VPLIIDDLSLEDRLTWPVPSRHFCPSFPEDRLAGFLRLSLPGMGSQPDSTGDGLADLAGAAIIREVHVYGQSLGSSGKARPSTGLGTQLIDRAEAIASAASAIGSDRCRRHAEYYHNRGFQRGRYLVKSLLDTGLASFCPSSRTEGYIHGWSIMCSGTL